MADSDSEDSASLNSSATTDSDEAESGSDEEQQLDIADCIDLKIGQAGVSALAFHTCDRRLACGTIDGRVRIYDTEGSLVEPLIRGRYHKCVRCVAFHGLDGPGQLLLSASSLGAFKLHDARTGGLAVKNNRARDCGINCLLSVNPNQFVTGDEDGWLSLFDLRKSQAAALSLHVQADWRPPGSEEADGQGEEATKSATAGPPEDGLCGVGHVSMMPGHVLAACEDGTLTTVSLNKRKVLMKSEFFGQPLTCVWPMKGGSKVVAGTESGSLLLFNKGELANISDKSSVLEAAGGIEAACPVGPDILVCACSDSRLHAVSVLPHARLDCLGRQPSDTAACLRVAADPTGALLASASPESAQIRLWSAGRLPELHRREVDRRRRNPSRKKRRAGVGGATEDGGGVSGIKTGKRETAGFLAGLVGD
ncbi:hypothetical protein BOX15_Mlig025974g2 [Macrostomum lignano]|uniref:WD_REPEATS_REGION domain-containing protein n=1 Tax=Macrostomum lignano TaxID=282301 RepID=A0A267DRY5_9PLAT|nr:hypothetical protein BOX15_Mlig025974g2 [Macrostomum lignano]